MFNPSKKQGQKFAVITPVIVAVLAATPAFAAPANEGTITRFSDLFTVGGPVMYPLIGLIVLAMGVALVKAVQFMRVGVGNTKSVRKALELVRDHDADSGARELDKRREPIAKVAAAAIRGKFNPRMDDILVREEVTRVAQAQLDGLERGLSFISLAAMILPLMGLLGTVLGLIQAFQQIQGAGSTVEPAMLAGGIWQALLTTAVGLTGGIAAVVAYTWLQRTVDVEAQRMEDAATQVFTADLFDATEDPSSADTGEPAEQVTA